MNNFSKTCTLLLLVLLSVGAAQLRPSGSLATFQKIRQSIEETLQGPLESAGPKVREGLIQATQVLQHERQYSQFGDRHALDFSIKRLKFYERRGDFIGPNKSRLIKEELALAEQRLIVHLRNVGRV